jgi:hypothetical protein
MMTFDQIATATLEQLTDELAAAGWDSCEDSIESARHSVARLLVGRLDSCELMDQLDAAEIPSLQNWEIGSTAWQVADELAVVVTGEDVEILTANVI